MTRNKHSDCGTICSVTAAIVLCLCSVLVPVASVSAASRHPSPRAMGIQHPSHSTMQTTNSRSEVRQGPSHSGRGDRSPRADVRPNAPRPDPPRHASPPVVRQGPSRPGSGDQTPRAEVRPNAPRPDRPRHASPPPVRQGPSRPGRDDRPPRAGVRPNVPRHTPPRHVSPPAVQRRFSRPTIGRYAPYPVVRYHGPRPVVRYYSRSYIRPLLPLGFTFLLVDGLDYYYYRGLYYRHAEDRYVIVPPPVGAVIAELPAGFVTFRFNGIQHYYFGNAYYAEAPGGYKVVDPPYEAQTESSMDTHAAVPAVSKVTVTPSILNVRSGPGMNHEIVFQVPRGMVLEIHGTAPDWLFVRLPSGEFGWVMAHYTVAVSAEG